MALNTNKQVVIFFTIAVLVGRHFHRVFQLVIFDFQLFFLSLYVEIVHTVSFIKFKVVIIMCMFLLILTVSRCRSLGSVN